LFWAPRKR